jgi:hypothetical protein
VACTSLLSCNAGVLVERSSIRALNGGCPLPDLIDCPGPACDLAYVILDPAMGPGLGPKKQA